MKTEKDGSKENKDDGKFSDVLECSMKEEKNDNDVGSDAHSSRVSNPSADFFASEASNHSCNNLTNFYQDAC